MDFRERNARQERTLIGVPLSAAGWLVTAIEEPGPRRDARSCAGEVPDSSPSTADEAAGAVSRARRWPGRFVLALGWPRSDVVSPSGGA